MSFAFIGFFVQAVFILCWLSAALFISHIFDGERWISIPIGIIWALLITNLYLLLLYTISPALLPVAHKKIIIQKGKKKKIIVENKKRKISKERLFIIISFLFRLGLIVFLSVLMSQPINVWLFANNYEEGDKFAEAIKTILATNAWSWVITVIVSGIMLLPVYLKYNIRRLSEKNFKNDFEDKDTSKGLKHLREQLSNTTDFENLSKQILSLNINAIRTSDFYFQKSLIEHRIILDEYQQFKKKYAAILTEKNKEYNRNCWEKLMPYINKLEKVNPKMYDTLYSQLEKDLQVQQNEFEKYEYWADHPFRTKHKVATKKLATETELLETFYQEKN
jgi:hypothetical protein